MGTNSSHTHVMQGETGLLYNYIILRLNLENILFFNAPGINPCPVFFNEARVQESKNPDPGECLCNCI